MDLIAHALWPLQPKLFDEILVRYRRAEIITGFVSSADVFLILKCLDSSIKELGRNDYGSSIGATRSYLNGFPLSCCNIVALIASELRERNGNQRPIVRLVQVIRNRRGQE